MEPTFAELIKNLNQTIDRLTKENEALRQNNLNNNNNSNHIYRDTGQLNNVDVISRRQINNANFAKKEELNFLKEAKDKADIIIAKSLDFAFQVKNDIIKLINDMKLYQNSPVDLLNAIQNFIRKNQNIFSLNIDNVGELSAELRQKITQKILKKK